MRKIVSVLMCLIVLLSFSSCLKFHTSNAPESVPESEAPIHVETDYSDVIDLYRKVIDACSIYDKENSDSFYAEKYGIKDPQEKKFFGAFRYEAYKHHAGNGKKDCFSPIYKLTWGYAQKDLNGDGADELILLNEDYTVIAIYSYADGKPTVIGGLNESYAYQRPTLENCWIDGDGYIYTTGPRAFEHKSKYRVAQDGASLEIIADYWLEEWMEYEPEAHVVTKYYMLMGDEEIEITESEYKALDDQHGKYLGQYTGKDVTTEYAGLTFIPLFSEAELLPSIYESVLNTQTKVYEVATGEFKFLKDIRTPYEQTLLADVTNLLYGFADFDGDGIDELVIDYGDRFILQYNNRRVYLYASTPDWENPQVNIEYSPMNESWNDRLSKEEAHEIACKYLGISIDGESTGACGTTICYDTVVVADPDEVNGYYHVIFFEEFYYNHDDVEGWDTHTPYSTYLRGEILVNATTGECFKTDLNILCEAVDSAAKYWEIERWEAETHAGIKTVSSIRIADFPHCENPYYRVVLKREYYVCHEDGSADATPYKAETLKEVFVDMWDDRCTESIDTISRSEAVAIAENYWKDLDIEASGYRIEIGVNSWAPDTAYVIVIQRYVIDHYSTFDEIWVDKNTGEPLIPYASDGKGSDDELTNSYLVTEDQAWRLANTYWDCQDGSKDYGAGTIWSAKIVVSDTPSSDDKYYKVDFLIEWISNGGSDGDDGTTPYAVHAMDRILINAFTGEITTPACEAGNKCISVEEAIEIVENHCKDADLDNGKNVYRGKLDVNASAPDHIYVIVIQKFVDNYYAYDTEYWIDKYTEEIVTPYYMYGKG